VDTLWTAMGLDADASGVEVGCGSGRFTVPILARARQVEAVDLSSHQLGLLRQELDRQGGPPERCRLNHVPIHDAAGSLPAASFVFVVGFFILHHLENPEASVASLRRLLRLGGKMGFLEPNRYNPLDPLQLTLCPDMSWREERLLFTLGWTRLRNMFEKAG